jgi:hypothetical protein
MNRIIRVISTYIPILDASHDTVFSTSGCPGGDQCTCTPYDHDDERATAFEPVGIVAGWLKENGYPIIFQDDRVLHLAELTEAQRLAFQTRWGV